MGTYRPTSAGSPKTEDPAQAKESDRTCQLDSRALDLLDFAGPLFNIARKELDMARAKSDTIELARLLTRSHFSI